MIRVLKFEAQHLEQLLNQPGMEFHKKHTDVSVGAALEKSEHAYTAVSQSGRVLLCAGVAMFWPGTGEAWAFFDPVCKREFLALHRAVKRFLETSPIRRIQAAVEVDFAAGHRWAKLLGFETEAALCKAYLPNGRDCVMYAKVRAA